MIARYADRDGVFRPADGVLAANTANAMFASATGSANATTASDRTRPIVLQRPFRSVGELGYVFRGQPWKTLDFFSADSADAVLLDMFCVSHASITVSAGKINPKSARPEVLQAIFSQTPYDEIFAKNPTAPGAAISPDDALALSMEFSGTSASLLNPTDFPALVAASDLALPTTLAKPSREAALRSLAAVSDFNTWRVFADIVVQSGRFSGGSPTPDRFVVESEERVWVSSAIGRNNGKILFRDSEYPVP